MRNIHENQVGEVQPLQYELEVGGKRTYISDQSDSDQKSDSDHRSDSSFSGEQIDRYSTLKLLAGVTVDIAL